MPSPGVVPALPSSVAVEFNVDGAAGRTEGEEPMKAKHSIIVWTARGNGWTAAAAVLLVLGLGACGGDGGNDGGAAAARRGVPTADAATPRASSAETRAPAEAPAPPVVEGGTEASMGAAAGEAVTYDGAEEVFRKGDYAAAARLFASYAERKPENVWGHYMRGLSAWKSGDRGTATEALERAVELAPDNVKARTNLGRVLLEEGRPEEAEPHLEHAVDVAPQSGDVWRVLGNVQAELGKADLAGESFRHALALNEADAWSMNNLGLLMIRTGVYEDALGPLARAVELKPGSPVFRNNLGVALERTGHTAAAADAYRAAIAADSTYRKASISLARIEPLVAGAPGEDADLVALARGFAEEVDRWAASVVAKSREPES